MRDFLLVIFKVQANGVKLAVDTAGVQTLRILIFEFPLLAIDADLDGLRAAVPCICQDVDADSRKEPGFIDYDGDAFAPL